ncbi:DNA polymerase III subunit beta [Marinicella gelatinilytica]|uniref:DNA polymerase III subunit beta n=1 Tax=Marinicella gelatinilytica TaxID=2996017 RepID=UPI002260EE06|nr:DNA polymerase III subunit beta [Marinicella gelatinilytica]MCX7545385.1 DNA polymerase III subunit beta [Marinicella gelatinilytica]
MLFKIQREQLLAPLNQICGVVEKKGTLPILSHVLFSINEDELRLTTSDLEVEMNSFTSVDTEFQGEMTLPAQKLLEICKSLPDGSIMEFSLDDNHCVIKSGDSRFSLSTLPANDYPLLEDVETFETVTIHSTHLSRMLKQTIFCMASHDVRYFLNGLLFEILNDKIRCVSADGHRLALSETDYVNQAGISKQILIPRKGVMELNKMIRDVDQDIAIHLGKNHVSIEVEGTQMTSKLIDGKFPDYQTVIPLDMENDFIADKVQLERALRRVAILSNEQYKGVKFKISTNHLQILGHNPDQEQAEDSIEVQTSITDMETAFNVGYLLDAINVIESDQVQFSFKDPLSSCLIKHPDRLDCRLVVMPLRI